MIQIMWYVLKKTSNPYVLKTLSNQRHLIHNFIKLIFEFDETLSSVTSIK